MEAPLQPDIVYIDTRARGLPTTQRILQALPQAPTELIGNLRSLTLPSDLAVGRRRWLLSLAGKPWLRPLHHTESTVWFGADFVTNTPYDCSFSHLPRRLTNPYVTIFVNIEEVLAELGRKCGASPGQKFVVRCGALGDALALDPITKFSQIMVPFFAWTPNAYLELVTRTANIAELLLLEPKQHTTVVMLLTPPNIIRREEQGTASLDERLAAAQAVLGKGYRLRISIDPILHSAEWEAEYDELLRTLFAAIPAAQIDGIELSCFHYPRGLTQLVPPRFPDTHIFFGELVPVNGCYRYFRPVRQQMYAHLEARIRSYSDAIPLHIVQEHGLIGQIAASALHASPLFPA